MLQVLEIHFCIIKKSGKGGYGEFRLKKAIVLSQGQKTYYCELLGAWKGWRIK